jgi:aryl-alcohol dehydrogenase-like predicted oxidoreductase
MVRQHKKGSAMEKRRLGHTDMEITTVGLGAWAIGGNGWLNGWGPQDDADSIATIHRAVERGINWIDTAAVYGLGHSESVVGRAVKGMRERPYVFTKCARVWDDPMTINSVLKAESVRRECEDSLRRLQVDVIDLYQIHWPRPEEDIEEGWRTLAGLQQEGKVRWIGVSNFDAAQMARAQAIAPIASLQPPYSLLDREIEDDALPYCREHGIGVIVYSPMKSGLLSGKMTRERALGLPADDWRTRNPAFQEPNLSRNLALVEEMRRIGARYGATPGEVAIAWTLRHPAVTGAIVGMRRPDQVDELADAGRVHLSDDDLAALDAFLAAV